MNINDTKKIISGVTVIVNCFNSEKLIAPTLRHIQAQDNPQCLWEVIVIDDNSKDNTSKVINEVWQENEAADFKLIKEPGIGKVKCIFNALQKAKYEYISIVDDDNRIEKDWIQKVFDFFENKPEYGVMGSRSEGEFDSEPPFWFSQFSKSYAIGSRGNRSQDITDKGWVWGAGCNIRKSAVEKLFALDWQPLIDGPIGRKRVAGEDLELCLAIRMLGYKIYFKNDLCLKHYMPNNRLTWEYLKGMRAAGGRTKMLTGIYQSIYEIQPSKFKDLPSSRELIFEQIKALFSNYRSVLKSILTIDEGDWYFLYLLVAKEYIWSLHKFSDKYALGNKAIFLLYQKIN